MDHVEILDASGAAFRFGFVERSAAHGDHLDTVAALYGGNDVAGVDGALEGVLGLHGTDIGNGLDVQEGRNPGHDVLAPCGGGGQDVGITLADLGDQGRNILRQVVLVGLVVGHQHLIDAGHLGGRLGGRATVLAGNQNIDITANGLGGSHCVQG